MPKVYGYEPKVWVPAAVAAVAGLGAAGYFIFRPKVTLIPPQNPNPSGSGVITTAAQTQAVIARAPFGRGKSSVKRGEPTYVPKMTEKGQASCVFGSDAETCDWSPATVQLLGKQKFRWGVCIGDWKEYLEEKTDLGKKQFWVDRLNSLLDIANTLALGLPDWLIEHACGMTQWEMLAYKINGSTYFGILFVNPEPHILTGEPVLPPPLPHATANTWIKWTGPNRMSGVGRASGNTYDVATLFFPDGHIREVVSVPQLRTAIRDFDIVPATLSDWTGSSQKWWPTTRGAAVKKFF